MLELELGRLRRKLIRRGMPIRHAVRIVGELAAHAEDIVEELGESGSPSHELEAQVRERLGDLDLLEEEINAQFARRTLWGRHPVTTFVLLPVISLSLLVFVPIWAGSLLGRCLDIMTGYGMVYDLNATIAFCRKSFDVYQYVFAFAGGACFVCILPRHLYSMKWSAVAAGILALAGHLVVSTIEIGPPVMAGKYLSGGFTVALRLIDPPSMDGRLLRCCIPLVLFFLMYGRNIWYGYVGELGAKRQACGFGG